MIPAPIPFVVGQRYGMFTFGTGRERGRYSPVYLRCIWLIHVGRSYHDTNNGVEYPFIRRESKSNRIDEKGKISKSSHNQLSIGKVELRAVSAAKK